MTLPLMLRRATSTQAVAASFRPSHPLARTRLFDEFERHGLRIDAHGRAMAFYDHDI